VPHALIREQVDTRATARTIEIFHRGKRVAAHARRYAGPRHGTLPSTCERAPALCRMDPADRFQRQARDIGPNTEALILAVLSRRPASGAGLSHLRRRAAAVPRHRAARAERSVRGRSRSGRCPTLRRFDLQTPARPEGVAASCGRHASAARQHPRLGYSIEENNDRAEAIRHWIDCVSLAWTGMAKAFEELEANPESRALETRRVARPAGRTGSHAAPTEALRGPRAHRQACGTPPPSRTSTSARPVASTERCSCAWPAATGSRAQTLLDTGRLEPGSLG